MVEDTASRSIIDSVLEKWQRRKWILIVSFLSVFSLATSLALALPSLYRSSTTILFGQDDIAETVLKKNGANELEMRLGIIRQALLSRGQLQDVIDSFGLYSRLRENAAPDAAIERLRKDIHIEQRESDKPQWGKNSTYAITISYQGWDPELVASVTNDLAGRFKAENEKIRLGQAVLTTEFISEQLGDAKQHFVVQEQRMNKFRNEHMGELPEQMQTNLARLQKLNDELQLNGDKQLRLLARRDAALYGPGTDGKLDSGAGLTGSLRLERLKRELAVLQTQYTDVFPEVIRLKAEIRKLTKEMSSARNSATDDVAGSFADRNPDEIGRELSSLKGEEARLRSEIAVVSGRIERTPKIDQELKRLDYDYESAKDNYFSLLKMHQDAHLAQSLETQQNQQIRVIEMAIPAAFPFAPDRLRLIFVGLVLASALAAAAMFLAEQLDQSFHSVADVRAFTNIPVIATVPAILTTTDRVLARARFTAATVMILASLIVITGFGYYAGKGAEQLVWALSV